MVIGWMRMSVVGVSLAMLTGCDTSGAQQVSGEGVDGGPEMVSVEILGTRYKMELAADNQSRVRGLSGRDSLEPGSGMLFAFGDVQQRFFVMRDCYFDIDIAYLDAMGKVISLHAMTVELREEGESDSTYELRLRKYPSFYGAAYAVEVIGGTWKRIGLEAGMTIEFDRASIKERVR
jgi:uncharacterized protein